ncbi:MAG: hypothetical protein M1826_005903 [Phylliscum demangeonii]|nr:MAG: hypothetical protein M1826_005903 [Phylliscum demangeonii]
MAAFPNSDEHEPVNYFAIDRERIVSHDDDNTRDQLYARTRGLIPPQMRPPNCAWRYKR